MPRLHPNSHYSAVALSELRIYISGLEVTDDETRTSYAQGIPDDLERIIHVIEDINSTNETLAMSGRSDLMITTPAEMVPVTAPDQMTDSTYSNSFPRLLQIPLGDRVDSDVDQDVAAITAGTYRRDDVMGGPFIPVADETSYDMILKPALQRAIVLAPGIMIPSIAAANRSGSQTSDRVLELLAAYTILSHLVDASDPYVKNSSGEADSRYLIR